MVVYSILPHEEVAVILTQGLKRSAGRVYVFSSWDPVATCLQAHSLKAGAADSSSRLRVLVLDVDEDILAAGPVPRSRLPGGLHAEVIAALQAQSSYIETDLDPERIIGIRNAMGTEIRDRFAKPPARRSNLWRFLAYVKPYAGYVLGATLAGVVKFLVPLGFPWMLRVVLDDIVLNPNLTSAIRNTRLRDLVLLITALNLVWLLATYFRSMYTAIAGHRMIRDLRVALYSHLQRLSHNFFAVNQSGSIVTRLVNDISQAQNLVGSALTSVWMDAILMIVLLCILVPMHLGLTAVALALMPVFLLSIRWLGRKIRLSSIEVQQRVEVLSGGLQEKVAGNTIVKGFTREREELTLFQKQSDKLYNKVLRSVKFSTFNEMMAGFVILTSPVLVVWYGGHLIMQGALTVGQLTQFLLYLGMFYAPIQRLSDLGRILASSLASIDRIFEYLDTMPHVAEKPGATALAEAAGRLDFEQVEFGYDASHPVIHDLTLSIAPGETLAFVGPSGSGKTTVANLIPRFYDPTRGVIRLDGHDLRDLTLDSLRRHIGVVNQETILFSGTIRENLLLARPDATSAQLVSALEAANARQFVDELPEGLWTEIGERGARLSGGQKQRLALARAFLKDPRILILDEATSALDSRSERLIQDALERLLKGRTSIVIAHRLSTILGADQIATLQRGRLVELGNHQQLLEKGGLYAQLYKEQFSRHAAAK